ncbi:MAG: MFS transporter [Armatimonadota bacterium]
MRQYYPCRIPCSLRRQSQGCRGHYERMGGHVLYADGNTLYSNRHDACKKSGKKLAMTLGLGFTGFGYLLIWWLFTPVNPWLQLIPFVFIGPAWNCCMIVLPSMLADICDVDELKTGLRREGMYGAINSWVMKMAIGAVTCITGVVVSLAGVNPDAAAQTASTLLKMRLMFVGLPVFFMTAAVLASTFYSITEHRAREVRAILDARKEQNESGAIAGGIVVGKQD